MDGGRTDHSRRRPIAGRHRARVGRTHPRRWACLAGPVLRLGTRRPSDHRSPPYPVSSHPSGDRSAQPPVGPAGPEAAAASHRPGSVRRRQTVRGRSRQVAGSNQFPTGGHRADHPGLGTDGLAAGHDRPAVRIPCPPRRRRTPVTDTGRPLHGRRRHDRLPGPVSTRSSSATAGPSQYGLPTAESTPPAARFSPTSRHLLSTVI
jgi:hypothetical protein